MTFENCHPGGEGESTVLVISAVFIADCDILLYFYLLYGYVIHPEAANGCERAMHIYL